MRQTHWQEKLSASFVNVLLVLLISIPVFLKFHGDYHWKIITALIFFGYETLCFMTPGKRDLGMFTIRTSWKNVPGFGRYIGYNLLYTLSFATVLWHIWFIPDLFLLNMCLIQIPFIFICNNTFHGQVTGMATVTI